MTSRYSIFDPHLFEVGDLVYIRSEDHDDGRLFIVQEHDRVYGQNDVEESMYYIEDKTCMHGWWEYGYNLKHAPHPLFGEDENYREMQRLQEDFMQQDLDELP